MVLLYPRSALDAEESRFRRGVVSIGALWVCAAFYGLRTVVGAGADPLAAACVALGAVLPLAVVRRTDSRDSLPAWGWALAAALYVAGLAWVADTLDPRAMRDAGPWIRTAQTALAGLMLAFGLYTFTRGFGSLPEERRIIGKGSAFSLVLAIATQGAVSWQGRRMPRVNPGALWVASWVLWALEAGVVVWIYVRLCRARPSLHVDRVFE